MMRAENQMVTYGLMDRIPTLATEDQMEQALRLACAWDFVSALPGGLHYSMKERGAGLSEGQIQRLAIARAILKDAPILVLDEATSALDSESEALIQEALANLMKGRTSIVVAHRLSTIRACDRIIYLEKGKIVEDGNYDELIALNGRFAELVERQRIDV